MAWKIAKTVATVSFRKALKAAWLIIRGSGKFEFYKIDGSPRFADATQIFWHTKNLDCIGFYEYGNCRSAKINNLI
jgi:hypothetical protein